MNFDLFLPKYNFFKLFVDVGNVWDKHLKSFKYDLGIGLDFKMIRVDFPFYINDPVGNEKNIAFRWLIEFNSIF